MKLKILLLINLFIIISCESKIINKEAQSNIALCNKYDSVSTELNIAKDSINYLNNLIIMKDINYEKQINALKQCDSSNIDLRSELFIAKYKLGRIKEYCEIVRKNNSQLVFLRGWINRVLED